MGKISERLVFPLIGVLLAAHLILWGFSPIRSEDTWWHLKQGELYLTTRSLPVQDPFAFTTVGRQWFHYSWLADVAFFLIYRAAGLQGLVLFRLFMLGAIALVLYRLLRACGLHPYACALLVFVAGIVLRFRLLIRPEIFSFLLLLVAMTVLLRLQSRSPWVAYLLWPLQAIWVNVHASFVFGIGLPALVLLTNCVPSVRMAPGWGRLQLDRTRLRHLAVCALGLPLASFLNPHGASLLLFPLRQNRMVRLTAFGEWMGAWQVSELGPGWWEILAALGVVVLAFLVIALWLFAREGRFDPVGWGILLSMGTYAVFRNRMAPYFVLALAPLLALAVVRLAGHVVPGGGLQSRQRLERLGVLACILVLGASLAGQALFGLRYPIGFGVRRDYFPEGAAAFLDRNHLGGRIFNTYSFGGYLIWRRWPANQVFIDGRYDAILFDEALFDEYVAAHSSPGALDRLTTAYAVDLLVLDVTPARGIPFMPRQPGWARVYWDQVAEVFVRRGGRFATWVPAHEYRLTDSRPDLSYLAAYRADPLLWRRALAELRRAVEDNPENVTAWLGLAQEYRAAGPAAAAEELGALDRAVALSGKSLGVGRLQADRAYALLKLGRLDEAGTAARQALHLQPDLILPRWVLATIAEHRGAWREAREHLQDLLRRLSPDDARAPLVRERLDAVEGHLRSAGTR